MKERELVLIEPDSTLLGRTVQQLNAHFSKQEVYQLCQELHPFVHSYSTVYKRLSTGKISACIELSYIMSQNTSKLDMMRGLAFFLCEPQNLRHYVDQLSAELQELWRRVLTNLYVSEVEARQILKKPNTELVSRNFSFYYQTSSAWNVKGLSFFSFCTSYSADRMTRYGSREREYFIYLRPEIHQLFFRLFFPDSDEAVFTSQLPSDQYLVFDLEAECVSKYKLLSSMLRAKEVGYTARGLSISDVKRVAVKLGISEPFSRDAPDPQPGICSRFYVTVNEIIESVMQAKGKKKLVAYEGRMRLFLQRIDSVCYLLIPYLLPHIKGLRKKLIEGNCLDDICRMLFNWLKDSEGQWVQIAEVVQAELSASDTDIASVSRTLLVFYHSEQTDNVKLVNDFSKKIFAVDSFLTEFGLTSLRAVALMMASLGLAEIALSPLHRPESPFARVEYVRLTPLGRYALGLEDTYEPPQMEQETYFELDPDRLIIRSLEEPNPYAQLLLETSVPISKTRYETSPRSFLASCKNRDDVENKIAVFRQFISSELPPLWKQFFDSLLRHCNPLKTDTTSYKHYRLDPDDTDLISLITTDGQLRQLVTRAEGYLILVKHEDIRKFEDLLKKHGYLL